MESNSHVVEEEVLDCREEVVVGEAVVGVREGVRDEASSRADSALQKPYRPSPVQDSTRRGSEGLLSRLAVHAARWDGEELSSSAMLLKVEAKRVEVCVYGEERPLLYRHGRRR